MFEEQLFSMGIAVGLTRIQALALQKVFSAGDEDIYDDYLTMFFTSGREKGIPEDSLKLAVADIIRVGPYISSKASALGRALLGYRLTWMKAHFLGEYYDALRETEQMAEDAYDEECYEFYRAQMETD